MYSILPSKVKISVFFSNGIANYKGEWKLINEYKIDHTKVRKVDYGLTLVKVCQSDKDFILLRDTSLTCLIWL